MKFRLWNKFFAHLFGYFWLPCQLCEREYGGHEWRDYNGLSSVVNGYGICPDCTKAGLGDKRIFVFQTGWVKGDQT